MTADNHKRHTLSVTVMLPLRQLNPCVVRQGLSALRLLPARPIDTEKQAVVSNLTVLVLKVNRSRVLWRDLVSCMFDSNRATGRCAVACILQSIHWQNNDNTNDVQEETLGDKITNAHVPSVFDINNNTIRKRRLNIATTTTTAEKTAHPSSKCILWVEPPAETTLETAWEGRLLLWEHKLMRAQSLTGYFATLGGGFFLCHHFTTAIHLAQQQQRMALLLNDYGMYYRCILNTAYNYVYAGHFRIANKLIRFVWGKAKDFAMPDPVLVKMCYSARLFSKRMREASKTEEGIRQVQAGAVTEEKQQDLNENKGLVLSKTIDDFARIRVFRDQSLSNDLAVPFGDHQNANTLYSECV